MTRPALACLVLAAAPACFIDAGFEPPATTTSAPGSSSGDESSTGAPTTAEPTGTTAAPTTSTTTTDATTGTTTSPGCFDVECVPDDTMDGAPCDACSVSRQTCQKDCQWGPAECVALAACGYWMYDARAGWTIEQPPPSEHAPKTPAAAAFDLAKAGKLVVLTESTYHVLSSDGEWLASGDLAALFPNLSGPVLQAESSTSILQSVVSVTTGDKTRQYFINEDTLKTMPGLELPCCGSWNQVSPPSLAAVRDIFGDDTNAHGWAAIDVFALCEAEGPPVVPYAGWVTPEAVYVQETDYCGSMVFAVPYAEFPPFAAPAAPPGDRVGGVTMLDGRLYVFPGE